MTHDSRIQTGAREAALILAGLKDRVDKLEKDKRGGSDNVQLFGIQPIRLPFRIP